MYKIQFLLSNNLSLNFVSSLNIVRPNGIMFYYVLSINTSAMAVHLSYIWWHKYYETKQMSY